MSNSDIIRSATSVAAQAIGIGDRVGTIEPGKETDLIMVTRNPMKDISALRTIDMVMKAGRIIAPHIPTES